MNLKRYFLVATSLLALSSCSDPQGFQTTEERPSVDAASTSVPSEVRSLSDYDKLEQAAISGDYQAQRNLAYTLATSIPYNPILGCAWRIVVVESGSAQVDQSDTDNKSFDCDEKLKPDEVTAAQAQAKRLQAEISGK